MSIRASATRTPAIEADAKTCAAPLPAEATAFELELFVARESSARRFTCLRHLHDFLPAEQAAREVVQQIIARCSVGQPRDEVVHSERKLCLRRERGVCLRADIGRARSVGSDAFSAGLRVCAKLRAERAFELDVPNSASTPLLNFA